ncbi:hypothetical protein J6590_001333 [Homalodisca vitripennis]|nr:hypothetical protein J6590_001333 [Homalodisca vitripennis]
MGDETVCKLLLYLKNNKIIDESLSKQNFCDLIFGQSEERLEILQWLVSQFSEDYKRDLQQTADVSYELFRKLHELELTTIANKLNFVKGKSSIEEQRDVYRKLIRALKMILPHEVILQDCPSSKQEDVSLQSGPTKGSSKLKRQIKPFNLNKALKNLDKCKKLLHNLESTDDKYSCSLSTRLLLETPEFLVRMLLLYQHSAAATEVDFRGDKDHILDAVLSRKLSSKFLPI